MFFLNEEGLVEAGIEYGRETRGAGMQGVLRLVGEADGEGDLKRQEDNPTARYRQGTRPIGGRKVTDNPGHERLPTGLHRVGWRAVAFLHFRDDPAHPELVS